jgi:hypothetical protein
LAKISISKTRMILQLLIARSSIYFVSKFCLFILFESFICLIVYFFFHYIVYIFNWISIDFNTYTLSCASNVIPQYRRRWRHFFEDPSFLASPSPPWSLPIYAGTMASVLAARSSPSSTHTKSKRYDLRVLEYIDLEAES